MESGKMAPGKNAPRDALVSAKDERRGAKLGTARNLGGRRRRRPKHGLARWLQPNLGVPEGVGWGFWLRSVLPPSGGPAGARRPAAGLCLRDLGPRHLFVSAASVKCSYSGVQSSGVS